MIEYVNEAGEVTMGTNFWEAYDKEWALQDQGRREGIEKGIEQGIEQGRKEKNLELAKKMKEKGISISDISDITNLSIKMIEKL